MSVSPVPQTPEEIQGVISQFKAQKPKWYERKKYLVLEKGSDDKPRLACRTLGLGDKLSKWLGRDRTKLESIVTYCSSGGVSSTEFDDIRASYLKKNIKLAKPESMDKATRFISTLSPDDIGRVVSKLSLQESFLLIRNFYDRRDTHNATNVAKQALATFGKTLLDDEGERNMTRNEFKSLVALISHMGETMPGEETIEPAATLIQLGNEIITADKQYYRSLIPHQKTESLYTLDQHFVEEMQ